MLFPVRRLRGTAREEKGAELDAFYMSGWVYNILGHRFLPAADPFGVSPQNAAGCSGKIEATVNPFLAAAWRVWKGQWNGSGLCGILSASGLRFRPFESRSKLRC
jgi:hypothetical protein